MLAQIRRFFTPPVFADEEKTRLARLLHEVLLAMLAVAILFAVYSSVSYPDPRLILSLTGVAALLTVGALILLRGGHIKFAGILFSSFLWIIVTFVAIASGGVLSTGFASYMTAIIVSGLLLGGWAAVLFAGLSALSGLAMVYTNISGIMPQSFMYTSPFVDWGAMVTNFLITALMLSLTTRSINEALKRAHRSAHAFSEANKDLQREIIGRKRVEQELEESHQMLRLILDTIPVRVFWKDRESVYLGCNRTFALDSGLDSPDELVGKNDFMMGWAEQAELYRTDDRRVIETEQPKLNYEEPQTTPSGAHIWLRTSKVPLIDTDGNIKGVLGTYEDITGQRQTEQALQRRLKELSVLYATAVEGTLASDVDGLIARVTQIISDSFYPDSCGVLLLDEKQKALIPHPSHRGITVHDLPASLPLSKGISGKVARSGTAYRVADVQTEPKYFMINSETRSELCVPIKTRKKVLGVLNVESNQIDFFSEEDEHLLSTIAGQLAMAIERLQLFKAEKLRRQEAETLQQAAGAISSTLELEQVLATILASIHSVVPYDSASIFLLEQDSLRLMATQGVETIKQVVGFTFPASNVLFQEIQKRKGVVLLADAQADARFQQWGQTDYVRGWMGVPLLVRGEVIGYITFDSKINNAYNEAMASLAQAFAHQAAAAIDNARLFIETRQRLDELEAVNRLSIALRESGSLDDMLPRVMDETLAILSTDAGAIYLQDSVSDTLKVAVKRGWFSSIRTASINLDEGIVGQAFSSKQAIMSSEFLKDPRTRELNREHIPAGWGGVCVPLQAAQDVVGMFIVSVPLPRQITPSEIRLLNIFSEIAGNAIRRVKLYEQTQRQLNRLASLRAIDLAISSILDLKSVLDVLLNHVTMQLEVDAVNVLLLNPYSQILENTADRGFRTAGPRRVRLRIGESQAGLAALERKRISIPCLPDDLEAVFAYPDLLKKEAFKAYFAVPLIAKGQMKGVLQAFHREPFNPDEEWLEFFETLANQVAIAVDNASLFEELQTSNLDLSVAYDATIEGWSKALDLRDRETEGHTLRVTEMTLRLAQVMGITDDALLHIRRGALLHDIGKMGVPDSILHKSSQLTGEEWEVMRRHPTLAFEMLSPIAYLRPALDIPYCHHEKWDGSGYPRGLEHDQIPLAARIFAVVDVWDALTSARPYREAWPERTVVEFLQKQAGKHFDPQVLEEFLELKKELE